MNLRALGYFPRDVRVPPQWEGPSHVTLIRSVSEHVNSAPPDWLHFWRHNDLGFFNTIAEALSVTPAEPHSFHLFAYRGLAQRFTHGVSERFEAWSFPVQPIPANYLSLGFDVVSSAVTPFFECSPLSCNGMAAEIPVNQHCLVTTLEDAIGLASRFSLEEPEPGPYFVVEVLAPATLAGA